MSSFGSNDSSLRLHHVLAQLTAHRGQSCSSASTVIRLMATGNSCAFLLLLTANQQHIPGIHPSGNAHRLARISLNSRLPVLLPDASGVTSAVLPSERPAKLVNLLSLTPPPTDKAPSPSLPSPAREWSGCGVFAAVVNRAAATVGAAMLNCQCSAELVNQSQPWEHEKYCVYIIACICA